MEEWGRRRTRRRRRERGGGVLSTTARWWCLMVRFAVIYSDSGPLPLFRFRSLGFIGFFRFKYFRRGFRSLKVTRSFLFFLFLNVWISNYIFRVYRVSSKILEDCVIFLVSDSSCLIKYFAMTLLDYNFLRDCDSFNKFLSLSLSLFFNNFYSLYDFIVLVNRWGS